MKKGKSSGRSNGLLPSSLKIISSCLKTVSSNATSVASTVRSARASVASSISADHQVLWAGFDKLELGPSTSKNVLLLGYTNGFQLLDVEDSANVSELVSKRGGPVNFLQMQPLPAKSEGHGGFRASHPLLVVVAGDEANSSNGGQFAGPSGDGISELRVGNCVSSPTAVRFYSLRSHTYIHVLRFRSAVFMIRCSPRIIAVGLSAQICCFDALTLESKFSVLTYPVPQVGGPGVDGVNFVFGPMAVGPRWIAYASNSPLFTNTGRLSPQNLTPPGVSPSTSHGSGNLVARYAMESSKQLASGILNLGDMGYNILSKYYQELLPDGSSSPVSSQSNIRFGRQGSGSHSAETDNAGMVVVKDFLSRSVISQFKAHTSPISALCFDPSGTLLVTASVYGNNINIFQIMPFCVQNGSGTSNYDWSSSHVHLYKLYRGITTAVIQDICFSQYSQWVAIISAKGTCHIFLLSPFGGDTCIQTQNIHSDTPTLLPGLSLPWWSTTSCMVSHQSCPPPPPPPPLPPPVTLSVVSRIKNGNSGWLSSVNSVAAYTTGKTSAPTGVVAAVFHNCLSQTLQSIPSKASPLEHLLVYTPCGHLVQHELLPLLGEPNDGVSRSGSSSLVHTQDEESRVKVEPVQWWYVCRRSDWQEREGCIYWTAHDRQEGGDVVMDNSHCENNSNKHLMESTNSIENGFPKSQERPHWYLSNAEVQISSGRIPIWQKSKIFFHMMISPRVNEMMFSNDHTGGEFEIEKVPVHEVEVKRKDLLPVFDHFHSVKSDWDKRVLLGGRHSSTYCYEAFRTKDKYKGETFGCHSKPTSLGSVEGSDAGSSRTNECLLDMDPIKCHAHSNHTMAEFDGGNRKDSVFSSVSLDQCVKKESASSLFQHSDGDNSQVETSCITNEKSCNAVSVVESTAEEGLFLNNGGISDLYNASSVCTSSYLNNVTEVPEHVDSHDPLDFGKCFQERCCKFSELDGCRDLTEVITNADSSSSNCSKEKNKEDEGCDDLLGGVFTFSEEDNKNNLAGR